MALSAVRPLTVGMGDAATLDNRLDAECLKVAGSCRRQLRKVSIKDLRGRGLKMMRPVMSWSRQGWRAGELP